MKCTSQAPYLNRRYLARARGVLISFFVMLLIGACNRTPPSESQQSELDPPPTQAITLSNARVMQVLPGKTMTSGYFDLHNSLPDSVALMGASSPATSSIEMHEIVQDGDSVSMRRLSSVEIDSGATLKFAKGAKHLMLFGVTELPDNLTVTLKFADGRETAATFQQQRW